jgi:hypothetical protein
MGCGGRGSVARETGRRAGFARERSRRARRATLKRTAKACGPGTRCWCQVGEGLRKPNRARETINSPATVARRIRRQERAIRRKTIRVRECRVIFRCLRCEHPCAYLLPPAHTGLRVHWAPGIPHALCFQRARDFWQSSGASVPRGETVCLGCLRFASGPKRRGFLSLPRRAPLLRGEVKTERR